MDTRSLSEIFVSGYSTAEDPYREAELSLESTLQNLVQAGRDAWPEVALSPAAFVQDLVHRIPSQVPVVEALSDLHGSDLYLACACGQGISEALRAFEQHYLSHVPGWVRGINTSAAFADEVCQTLREKLFVPPHGSIAKIAEYSGRGHLLSWLRVAAMRTAIDLSRKSRPLETIAEDKLADQVLAADSSPEAAYIKAHYQDLLRDAFRQALSALDDEEHNLIRLYYEHALSMEQLGLLLGVNRSTIKRRLDGIYRQLHQDIKDHLQQHLQVNSAEFRSLVTLLVSRFELGTTTP